ncbi:MAG TPA: type II secretion system protein GspI [Gammaproteobacteria bacterium]|nr:type II secretion system protein GspI [Gammaproteobacteria bacterium]
MKATAQQGFTLMEVLVALAVLAVSMAALIQTAANNASNAGHLRDKVFALWVAENRLAELRVADTWPDLGKRSGDVEMANYRWYWTQNVVKTVTSDLREVTVEVRKKPDSELPVSSLVTYLGKP